VSDLDLAWVRARFPALGRSEGGQPVAYFDGPAGSQVPDTVIAAVADYLAHHNANTHGAFASSRETDAMLADARAAMADLLAARDPDEVVFGASATAMVMAVSRAMARTWQAGDEVVVTELDHDANVAPWLLAARDAGAVVRTVPIRPDTTLDRDAFRAALGPRTRLVAVTAASNATGTTTPLAELAAEVHAVGAELFVDAVHYAPHRLIDVAGWDADFLVCSPYKFFAPHLGVLWGRRERLAELPAYKVRPAGDAPPDRWESGTGNHEGIAGTRAAVAYLAELGRRAGGGADRRAELVAAYRAIAAHERGLCQRLLAGLAELPSVTVWGIADPARQDERVPTVSLTHARHSPEHIAEALARRGIWVWHGNYYALELSQALGREPDGMVRVGLLHYNRADEVDRLLAALAELG
jgi:cysteine desulfurase family protein (TIGR01976 family)